MAFLSNLFSSNDTDSTEASSNDFWSDLEAVVSVNSSNEYYHESIDDDGASDTTAFANDTGLDLDLGNVLSSMTDSLGSFEG